MISDVEFKDGCWLSTKVLNSDGYATIKRKCGERKRSMGLHRFMYCLFRGIPNNELDHLCRNRHCINPWHLEDVTHSENIRRGNTGKWQRDKTHCPKGHPYSGNNLIIKKYYNGPRAGRSERRCKVCSAKK